MKRKKNRDKDLPVVRPVNSRFREARDYRTYPLAENSSHQINEEVAWSFAKSTKDLKDR